MILFMAKTTDIRARSFLTRHTDSIRMKQLLFIAFVIFMCSDQIKAQSIGHTTITYTDSSRNNRAIATEIYYPATTAGDNTAITEGTFPIITFGHGFVMTWTAYQHFWEELVPLGYILAFPTTESSFIPNHDNFGKDLRFIITEIQNNGAGLIVPSTSVASTSAIMGHSMGGGSSFLAAENNTDITTMVSFAAANTNPSSIDAAALVNVPTLLFSGVNDYVTPPAEHQNLMYDATTAAYKTQVNITGGGHCYFANDNFNCSFGEGVCSPDPTITRAEQQNMTHDFLQPWLAYYLKNVCAKAQEFQDSLSTSTRITYSQSLPIGCSLNTDAKKKETINIHLYPNPCASQIVIESNNEHIHIVTLYNTMMQTIGSYTFSGTKTANIDVSSLPDGLYFIQCNTGEFHRILKENARE
jgi:predicted dienelactone hydrolase